jgi:hypothetical protein
MVDVVVTRDVGLCARLSQPGTGRTTGAAAARTDGRGRAASAATTAEV